MASEQLIEWARDKQFIKFTTSYSEFNQDSLFSLIIKIKPVVKS